MIRNLEGKLAEFNVDGVKYVLGCWNINIEKEDSIPLSGEPENNKETKLTWRSGFNPCGDKSIYDYIMKNTTDDETTMFPGVTVEGVKFYISEDRKDYYIGDIFLYSHSINLMYKENLGFFKRLLYNKPEERYMYMFGFLGLCELKYVENEK